MGHFKTKLRCNFCKGPKAENGLCKHCGICDDNILGSIADFSYSVKKATKGLTLSASKRHQDKEQRPTSQEPETNRPPFRLFLERFASIFLIIAILLALSYVYEEGYFDGYISLFCFFKFFC